MDTTLWSRVAGASVPVATPERAIGANSSFLIVSCCRYNAPRLFFAAFVGWFSLKLDLWNWGACWLRSLPPRRKLNCCFLSTCPNFCPFSDFSLQFCRTLSLAGCGVWFHCGTLVQIQAGTWDVRYREISWKCQRDVRSMYEMREQFAFFSFFLSWSFLIRSCFSSETASSSRWMKMNVTQWALVYSDDSWMKIEY